MGFSRLFSRDEIRDIMIAIAALTIIFSFPDIPRLLPLSFIAVVVAFLFHELAHKFVAQKFGLAAFFKIWPMGIIIGLVFMFTPLKFVAPGAVMIYPYRFGKWKRRYEKFSRITQITIKQLGIVAIAGPLVNIFFATVFLSLVSFAGQFAIYLALINSWLALINLIPVNPLDGAKVFTWKPWLWFVAIVLSVILLMYSAGPIFG